MYRRETGAAPIHYIGPGRQRAGMASARGLLTRLNELFPLLRRGLINLWKLPSGCKNLKQRADIYLDGSSRKETARKGSLVKEIHASNNPASIPVSLSGPEFFLDKVWALAYHAAKFWGRFVRSGIFRLRGSAKLINWPTCVDARMALPIGIWVRFAVGRERQLGYTSTSARSRNLRDEVFRLHLSICQVCTYEGFSL